MLPSIVEKTPSMATTLSEIIMIHHISIAADQPMRVAQVLAEICQGQSAPFPFHPDCYVTLALDPHGTMIEVIPRGTEFIPRHDNETTWSKNSASSGYSPFHAAISVPTSEAQVHEIAERAGWQVAQRDRRGYFSVIEVWVENQQLLEFLPPTLAAQYLDFMHPRSLQKFLSANPDQVNEMLKAGQ